jgi:hypothetical protein
MNIMSLEARSPRRGNPLENGEIASMSFALTGNKKDLI